MTTFNSIELAGLLQRLLKKKRLCINRYKQEPEYGYMVSLKKQTKTYKPTTHKIAAYIDLLFVTRDKYLQAWKEDDGFWYFDIAVNLHNLDTAKALAIRNKVIVWDVVNNCEVK